VKSEKKNEMNKKNYYVICKGSFSLVMLKTCKTLETILLYNLIIIEGIKHHTTQSIYVKSPILSKIRIHCQKSIRIYSKQKYHNTINFPLTDHINWKKLKEISIDHINWKKLKEISIDHINWKKLKEISI